MVYMEDKDRIYVFEIKYENDTYIGIHKEHKTNEVDTKEKAVEMFLKRHTYLNKEGIQDVYEFDYHVLSFPPYTGIKRKDRKYYDPYQEYILHST
jgi:hypothetical protein